MPMSTSNKLALIDEYASIARALASPHRMRLLEQLAQGEKGVDALAERTDLTFANCSQHLQELRRVGLVTSRREGKAVIYRLTDDDTLRLMSLIQKIARNNISRVDEILDGIAGGIERPEPVSREVLAERLASGDVVVLDIRPLEEYASGHIPGALSAPLEDVGKLADSLDPSTPIYAYCRGPYCLYADRAAAELRQRGFDARTVEGGLPDWRADGRPVAEGDKTVDAVF